MSEINSNIFLFRKPVSSGFRSGALPGSWGSVVIITLLFLSQLLLAQGVRAEGDPCISGILTDGAGYQIFVPEGWHYADGQLLVYVPGYRSPGAAPPLPDPDPQELALVNSLGFAFAIISYRQAGLAVKEGVEDLGQFLAMFNGDTLGCGYGRPKWTYVAGGSMGGLVATLKAEQEAADYAPQLDGVLALCGPVGDFHAQLNYILDVRVVFDVLFGSWVIPGSAVNIPDYVIADWEAVYEPRVRNKLLANGRKTRQLVRLTGVAAAADTTAARAEAVVAVLRYNIAATNNAREVLGGSVPDNSRRIYVGSGSWFTDWYVNRYVRRYHADPAALAELHAFYQTSGRLAMASQGGSDIPVVSGHNVSDSIVPWWHEVLYAAKLERQGSLGQFTPIPIFRYGHCNFSETELLGMLAILTKRVTGSYQFDPLVLLK